MSFKKNGKSTSLGVVSPPVDIGPLKNKENSVEIKDRDSNVQANTQMPREQDAE